MTNSQTLSGTLSEARSAEDIGQYERAFQMLGTYWDDFSQFPNTTGLSGEESAELFLRFGGIIGFLGNGHRFPNSQEVSKNLLSQARQRFLARENYVRAAECENYLALAYSRTGEFSEALDWLNEALSRSLSDSHPIRIESYVIETLLDMDSRKYQKIVRRSEELRGLFETYASDLKKGCFYNHLAVAQKELGRTAEALVNLRLASGFFQKAGHEIYYGATENNLAQFLHADGQFDDAHACAKNARFIFERIGDRMREGYSLETRAQIFAAEGNHDKALTFVNSAIDLLEGGESYRKLVDSYCTKIKILLKLGRLSESLTTMTAAHNLAALYISQDLSREIIENVAALIEQNFAA